MPRVIEHIVYQHAENACALWWQWQLALQQPHYRFNELCTLERRLTANLDGLRLAGDAALPILRELSDAEDEGAVFVTAILALRKKDKHTFMELLDACSQQTQTGTELQSALAWVGESPLQGLIIDLLDSAAPFQQSLGLSACLAYRRDPGKYLEQALTHEDTGVRSMALRATADLADTRQLSLLPTQATHESLENYELARALLSLSQYDKGLDRLESIALDNLPTSADATRLLLMNSKVSKARSLLKELNSRPDRQRDVVRGFGILGDPSAIDWLIQCCDDAALARLAGESISMITGVNLADETLELDDAPVEAESALNDNPADDHVQLDEDENLDWPDIVRLAAWWQASNSKLTSGKAHLCGFERSPDTLHHVLRQGLQRQRTLAADLLMTGQTGSHYCNTRLPSQRQTHFMTGVSH